LLGLNKEDSLIIHPEGVRIQIKQPVSRPLSSNQEGVYRAAELNRLRSRLKRLLLEQKHNKTGKMTLNYQILNFLLYEMYD